MSGMTDRDCDATVAEAHRLRKIAEELEDIAGRLDPAGDAYRLTYLRGVAIARALVSEMAIGDEMHFSDMILLLRKSNKRPTGDNPAATLLEALRRSPQFKSCGAGLGRYRRIC